MASSRRDFRRFPRAWKAADNGEFFGWFADGGSTDLTLGLARRHGDRYGVWNFIAGAFGEPQLLNEAKEHARMLSVNWAMAALEHNDRAAMSGRCTRRPATSA
jgi:hypothetical protein